MRIKQIKAPDGSEKVVTLHAKGRHSPRAFAMAVRGKLGIEIDEAQVKHVWRRTVPRHRLLPWRTIGPAKEGTQGAYLATEYDLPDE